MKIHQTYLTTAINDAPISVEWCVVNRWYIPDEDEPYRESEHNILNYYVNMHAGYSLYKYFSREPRDCQLAGYTYPTPIGALYDEDSKCIRV